MWPDTNGKNLRSLWGLRFFCMKFQLYRPKIGIYRRRSSYIIENMNISTKIQLYLTKIGIYRRKSSYIAKIEYIAKIQLYLENRNISTKIQLYLENKNISRKSNYIAKVEIYRRKRQLSIKIRSMVIFSINHFL